MFNTTPHCIQYYLRITNLGHSLSNTVKNHDILQLLQ